MDDRDKRDYANYDMHIDNAIAMNAHLLCLPDVYYFSVPCCSTVKQPDGTYRPDRKKTEPLFVMRSTQMGQYKGKTKGGASLDETWQENDGLVNTISSKVPTGAASKKLDPSHILPGLWNVFPTYDGDHMSLQGGLMKKQDIRPFYKKLLRMITEIEEKGK